MFYDRIEAGQLLAQKLGKYRNTKSVLMAIPRGGVPVAFEIGRELNLPITLCLSKKIGHPLNKEYAIGAASINDYIINSQENIDEHYIQEEVKRVQNRLREMDQLFLRDKSQIKLNGKILIIIDDGIATGNTLFHSIQLIKKNKPLKIVIAVPVASNSSVIKLKKMVDDVIVLESHEIFGGVGNYYECFDQVTDEEVIQYLKLAELNLK